MSKADDKAKKDNLDETTNPIDKDGSMVTPEDISVAAEAEEALSETGDEEVEMELDESQQIINSLTEDLQRTRADFENYQRRSAAEKNTVRSMAVRDTVSKLLPVVDIIEQATHHMPEDIVDTPFGKGMSSIDKKLNKQLSDLGVKKIEAKEGDEFNPQLHNAIQADEDAVGDTEILESVMQAGYEKDGEVIRYAMVRVTRK